MSQIIPYLAPGALTNTQSDVTDLQTLSGMPDNSVDLGTFTGSTIPDNQTTKQALQALETEVENRESDIVQSRVGTGPGYYFDSTSDVISTSLNLSGYTDFTFAFDFDVTSLAAGQRLLSDYVNALDVKVQVEISTAGEINTYLYNTTLNSSRYTSPPIITIGKKYNLVVTRNSGVFSYFINGKKIQNITTTVLAGSGGPAVLPSTAGTVSLGRINGLALNNLTGHLYSTQIFNRALTASEVALVSRGQRIGFTDRGADGTEATSGTLTIGKRYRISDFQSGDDFTNVGAASNATGVEFVATGTTPTTWTNSSGVTQIGEVLALLPGGAAPAVWADQSGNGYNGTVTGATLINPMPLHADAFVSLTNLPTSSAGLATGQVWNDSGTLKIV